MLRLSCLNPPRFPRAVTSSHTLCWVSKYLCEPLIANLSVIPRHLPHSSGSDYSNPLPVAWAHQACPQIRVFALAGPFAWKTLTPTFFFFQFNFVPDIFKNYKFSSTITIHKVYIKSQHRARQSDPSALQQVQSLQKCTRRGPQGSRLRKNTADWPPKRPLQWHFLGNFS